MVPKVTALSPRKISAVRLIDFRGPRRKKPKMNDLKTSRDQVLNYENEVLAVMFRDDRERASIDAGMGRPRTPMSVWTDSDQSWTETWLQPCELPKWEQLSERMKIFIGLDVGMEFGFAYSISANISQALIDKWECGAGQIAKNVKQRVKRQIASKGIHDIPIAWVMEARTKTGKSRTNPHLHGVVLCREPYEATKVKLALEKALAVNLDRKSFRKATHVIQSYAKAGDPMGRFAWVSYITKNAHRYDKRLGHRRVYISTSFTQVAKLAWSIRRDE
jgi:hypothetical protein